MFYLLVPLTKILSQQGMSIHLLESPKMNDAQSQFGNVV